MLREGRKRPGARSKTNSPVEKSEGATVAALAVERPALLEPKVEVCGVL
jgi:hypothetical protein